ncbi:MBL fold metallo-hydrolase [Janibacter cremeus]|uniref:MBL fold metallo-hydrolase n=1 Tax=Janibacter cremeus TaxID=1285192 RepID=UPI0023F6C6B4|nr:MBL fold metallo-hydrolase [Janibacter cremeus]WEV77271.1 MBL fold metallo-hydrolase [Janibacter cremeus]
MILTQYYLSCLSHGSYLIADEGSRKAVVVDPRRDISDYLADAKEHDLDIVGVINTHVHADFVAGHLELAAATGAWIGYGPTAAERAEFDVRTLTGGDRIELGDEVVLEILETPGHTWESISVLVLEQGSPHAVLTGDSLFIGGVGRPDLVVSDGSTPQSLAEAMYSTLHSVLLPLPDDTRVMPAHGAGSSCGRGLSDELESNIGAQRATNPFAAQMPVEDFVGMVTTGQPSAPAYFQVDAALNLRQRELLDPDEPVVPFTPTEVRAAIEGGAVVVDTRSPEDFAVQHLAGSVNIGLDGRFAETAGMVLDHEAEILVLAEPGRQGEAALRLGRIGFDGVVGYVDGSTAAFAEMPDLVTSVERVEVDAMDDLADETVVLDVRNAGEREDGQLIPEAVHIPLAELARRHDELPSDRPVLVHCAGGWRSSVAASLLRSQGHTDVTDLVGGYAAWAEKAPARV